MPYGELVSIIVPIYNRAHLIARSVGSLLHQSYDNLEVILADDCSTDDLEGAVAALQDPRLRIVRRDKNGGASAARNTGIAAARGQLIAFHDSDDIALFDRIEKQVRALTDLGDDHVGVYSGALFFSETDEASYHRMALHIRPFPGSTPLSGDMYDRTVQGNAMNLPTMLLRREAVLAAGGFDERLGNNNDWDFALRVTQQGKFHFIPEPLYLVPTTLDPKINAQRISRSLKYHTKSFAFITGKLRRQGVRSPALAAHYGSTANFLIRSGRSRFARRYLRAALAISPRTPRLWMRYVFSYAPGLYLGIRAWRRRAG